MGAVGPTFPVVGLGGSAGGLQAFFEFFESLSTVEQRPAMSFIVVLHLPRDEESHLPQLLQQRTGLAVRDLEVQTEVAPDVIYVLPPDRTLASRGGLLELCERARGTAHHPVDDAFSALASAFGERSVAIVCSGTGSNGSSGLTAVREAGGCVIAQAPESAEFDEMPRNAIQTGAVDVVAPPAG